MPNTLIYHAIYGMIPIKDNRWGDTMQREDEWNEFKKTTGELNEAMVSIAAMLNKHQKGKVYFGGTIRREMVKSGEKAVPELDTSGKKRKKTG